MISFGAGSMRKISKIVEFRLKMTKQTARERVALSGGLFPCLRPGVIVRYKKVEFCGFYFRVILAMCNIFFDRSPILFWTIKIPMIFSSGES